VTSLFIATERIEKKVERIPESGCWVWMGTTTVRGYGQIEHKTKKLYAHRASYEAFVGEIPQGMYVCHTCDNVSCVNPNHLFLGTQKQNLQDMAKKGRSTRGEKNPGAKLTEEQVNQIRTMDGTCSFISKIFNVSSSAISAIKRKERWSYV
jgi:hypothetical protein